MWVQFNSNIPQDQYAVDVWCIESDNFYKSAIRGRGISYINLVAGSCHFMTLFLVRSRIEGRSRDTRKVLLYPMKHA